MSACVTTEHFPLTGMRGAGVLEEEQGKVVGEERGVCVWLFMAPGSPAMCCVELLELGRLASSLEALVFLPSPLGCFS